MDGSARGDVFSECREGRCLHIVHVNSSCKLARMFADRVFSGVLEMLQVSNEIEYTSGGNVLMSFYSRVSGMSPSRECPRHIMRDV